jgi:hypothetical protein
MMRKLLASLKVFANAVKDRIAKAEHRQKIIRDIIDNFFSEDR